MISSFPSSCQDAHAEGEADEEARWPSAAKPEFTACRNQYDATWPGDNPALSKLVPRLAMVSAWLLSRRISTRVRSMPSSLGLARTARHGGAKVSSSANPPAPDRRIRASPDEKQKQSRDDDRSDEHRVAA